MYNIIPKLGEHGSIFIEDTDAHSGLNCHAIQIIEDTVFTTLTDPTMEVADSISGITFPAGIIIFGAFTTITLASGSVLAYKAQ